MASKEGIYHNEIEFQKTFFTMSDMVEFLYDNYLEWKRLILGESSKSKIEEGEDPPPPSPPFSPNPPQENIPINTNMICLY
jgi:hypothetical protein